MNHVVLVGRLVSNPDLKYSQKNTSVAIARYTLAVDRRFSKNDNEKSTDFIRCVAFKKSAEFAMKYFKKGQRIAIEGRLQTNKYNNKEGITVYTTDVIIENQEFADSPAPQVSAQEKNEALVDGFMEIEGSTEEDLPF